MCRHGAGGLSAEDHSLWVAAEGFDVVAQPLERESLVADAEVLGAEGRRVREAEDVEAITGVD
jgi:hypothetical protein